MKNMKSLTSEAKLGKLIYAGKEGRCYASDKLTWVDANLNPIETPEKIKGDFKCSCTKITSFEGVPRYVGGTFSCSWLNITSLDGAPLYVGGNFNCSCNVQLTTLRGAEQLTVGGDFICSYTNITSLEGAPHCVRGDFDCSYNEQLTSLEGAPLNIKEYLDCSETCITDEEIKRFKKANNIKYEIFKAGNH